MELSQGEVSLVNLRHLNSKFRRKINESKALQHYLYEAHNEGETTEHDWQRLEDQLNALSNLKQEYELAVWEYSKKYGSQAEKEFEDASKALEKLLAWYSNVTFSVEKTIARLRNQPDINKPVMSKEKEEDADSNSQSDEHEETDEVEDDLSEEDEERASVKISVLKGFLIVIVFYAGLGIVINFVMKSWTEDPTGV